MIEKKLGIVRFVQYGIFILIMYAVFNFNAIVENVVKIQTEINKKEHERRLQLRDELIDDLEPLLVEIRSGTKASRILYFEYHNSTENFIGIPFKFASLVLSNQSYECRDYDQSKYLEINSGLISGIYGDLKKNGVLINKGILSNDTIFYHQYPGIHEFFSAQDGSVQQAFINIPGVNFPVGMIVIEWIDKEIKSDEEWEEIKTFINTRLSRINAVITKYTP